MQRKDATIQYFQEFEGKKKVILFHNNRYCTKKLTRLTEVLQTLSEIIYYCAVISRTVKHIQA